MKTSYMRKELKCYGFQYSFLARYVPMGLVLAVLILALLGWRFSETVSGGKIHGNDAAGGVVAIGAFIVAYQQWRAARKEASMDKYYERLDLANRRKEVLPDIKKYDMYVFTELDNLEYMLERYNVGYTTTAQAFRCLKSFQSRCTDPIFRDSARRWAKEAGYHDTTQDVVNQIAKQA